MSGKNKKELIPSLSENFSYKRGFENKFKMNLSYRIKQNYDSSYWLK